MSTEFEFDLRNAVGGDGNALKKNGQGIGGGLGTDASGFSALIGGSRLVDGLFGLLGNHAYFWSSTQEGGTDATVMRLRAGDASILTSPLPWQQGVSVRCVRDQMVNLPPAVPWNPIPDDGSVNTSTSPTLRWSCIDPDGDPLAYDVYFGRDNLPTDPVISNHPDDFLPRFGLADGATYHWMVVAKDDHGHSTVGPEWSFTTQSGGGTPCPGTPTVTYSGKTYNTVQVGAQCWLRENLDVGTRIDGTEDQTNNGNIEKYCFDDSPSNCNAYGGLYQWDEAMQYLSAQGAPGICPPGWHLPTLAEFEALGSAVGSDGNALKAIGQGTGGGAGTNTSGFSALLAGNRYDNGSFSSLGFGFFWSSMQYDAGSAYYLLLVDEDAGIRSNSHGKAAGFSVRCLKD